MASEIPNLLTPTVLLDYSRTQEELKACKQEMVIRRVELPSEILKLPPRPCKASSTQEVLNEDDVARESGARVALRIIHTFPPLQCVHK